jgi:hypothetical protein
MFFAVINPDDQRRRAPERASLRIVTARDRSPGVGVRERAGVALLRVATRLARERQAVVHGVSARSASYARDRALADLAMAAWVESVLLWLAWRLLPGDALSRRASSFAP